MSSGEEVFMVESFWRLSAVSLCIENFNTWWSYDKMLTN